jgi:hypothetical protein
MRRPPRSSGAELARGAFRRIAGLALASVLLAAPGARAQSADYEQLVDAYAHGAIERPVVVLAAWPEARLRAAFLSAHLPPERIKAAAMLHTETAMVAPDPWLAYLHMDRAWILLDSASQADREAQHLEAFIARWHAVQVLFYATFDDFPRARAIGDRVFLSDEHNRDLRLVYSAMNEIAARHVEPNLRGRWNTRNAPNYGQADSLLHAAVLADQDLLKRNPDFVEARARLAALLLETGAPAPQIAEQLDRVFAETSRPELLYVAHLLRGAVRERDGRLEDAEAEYRSAHGILPRQASFVALMHVDHTLGRQEDAARLARELAAAGAAAGADDPWRRFTAGVTDGELMEWLRHEAQSP